MAPTRAVPIEARTLGSCKTPKPSISDDDEQGMVNKRLLKNIPERNSLLHPLHEKLEGSDRNETFTKVMHETE